MKFSLLTISMNRTRFRSLVHGTTQHGAKARTTRHPQGSSQCEPTWRCERLRNVTGPTSSSGRLYKVTVQLRDIFRRDKGPLLLS